MRWPAGRIGPLLILAGFAHFAYAPGLPAIAGLWLLSAVLSGLELFLVALVFLSYPTGRLVLWRTERAPNAGRTAKSVAG